MTSPCYDARAHGADCDNCPLQHCAGPVPPENHNSAITFVGEAPGEEEIAEGRPFVGAGGLLLSRVLGSIGIGRMSFNFTTVVLCRPPDNQLKMIIGKVRRERKKAEKRGDDASAWPKYPQECCRPRLLGELASIPNLIPVGGFALKAIFANEQMSILKHRGNVHDVKGIGVPDLPGVQKILPTVAPSFVARRKSFMRWFTEDLGRAWRWFHGQLNWTDPTIAIVTHPDQLEQWFEAHRNQLIVYDVETFVGDPMSIDLKCVGFSTEDVAVVLPWLRWVAPVVGVDGEDDIPGEWIPRWSVVDQERLWLILRAFFAEPTIIKGGWNSGYFDRMVIENHFGVTPTPHVDGILLHKVVQPEMRHALAVVAPGFLDVHAWKGDAQDKGYLRTGQLLHEYCAIDCVVNRRLLPILYKEAKERKQLPIFEIDQAMQDVCVGFHKEGMYIDQEVRSKLHAETMDKALMWAADARTRLSDLDETATKLASRNPLDDSLAEEEAVEDAEFIGLDTSLFNPGSPIQVGRLLYERWQLPIPKDLDSKEIFTEAGTRSTSDAVLRAYICDRRLDKPIREFIQSVRMYRKKTKLLGTYLRSLRFEPGCKKPICRISKNGRIHASWNAHGTSVGRLSASLVQTFPGYVMKCVTAPPGWTLVYADMDQLHLRIIASKWQVKSLLEVFRDNLDPHGVFAEIIMGDTYRKAHGYKGYGVKPAKGLANNHRDVAKRLRFAGAYWAQPPTIHRVLLSAENDGSDPTKPEGTLTNPGLKPRFTKRLHADWMSAEPEWEAAWDMEMATWQNQGHLVSPLLGRRKDFPDGKKNDIVNYPIISMEGDIMCLITIELAAELKRLFPSAKFINQCHDSILIECVDRDAEGVKKLTDRVMNRTLPGWEVPFTAQATSGHDWATLKYA